ncbi:uncharacterized protein AKAW2_30085S [Aspergillus luchuensis]|uniref:KH domain protein n=1 Tax=Aspergillus kawachii TaxID=1069201 RepID=A0A146FK13_ASPKA|nr:uncharacterized protein AKAW2_30085S [Aspergillus luchuensis]BCR96766.1 hypothetical protein AKAW2_30085S [Aspergillus luchuensis]GAT26290.1 KH domain protein [Aspergillus luchuensis]
MIDLPRRSGSGSTIRKFRSVIMNRSCRSSVVKVHMNPDGTFAVQATDIHFFNKPEYVYNDH